MIVYTNYLSDPRVRREAEILARYGNTVRVLSLTGDEVPKRYQLNDVQVIELKVKKYRGGIWRYFLSYIKFLFYSGFACTQLFFQRKIDMVHVHNMPDFLVLAGIVPRLFGKRLVLDIHDSMPETFSGKFGNQAKLHQILCLEERLSCALAHQVICVNHIQRNALVERGIPPGKITIVLNVPDQNLFRKVNRPALQNQNKKPFKIVYHGTIEKMLGIDLVIEGVARIVDQFPNIEFHVIGSGKEVDTFVELSKKLKIEQHIHFSRKTYPVDGLPSLLQEMDLGIIPNRRNIATELMLPVKLLEYIALGIPVVAPRLRAIQYYFTDEMIGYYTPEDVDSMIVAILTLYQDADKRRRQSEKAITFLDQYGWETHQKELIKLYEKM